MTTLSNIRLRVTVLALLSLGACVTVPNSAHSQIVYYPPGTAPPPPGPVVYAAPSYPWYYAPEVDIGGGYGHGGHYHRPPIRHDVRAGRGPVGHDDHRGHR